MAASDTAIKAFTGENGNLPTDKNFGSLKFPTANHDAETGGHSIVFTEYKYSRPSVSASYKPIPTGTTITLPLPKSIVAGYSADWQDSEMGAFGQVLSDSIPGLIKDGASAVRKIIDNPVQASIDGARSLLDYKRWSSMPGVVKGASALGTDILTNNPIFRNATTGTGVARNPFLAAQFEGVKFRSFPFEYDLVPRSKQDSQAIEKIIKAFKYGMHPSYVEFGSLKNALFRYPNIYKPQFTKNAYLFDFGICVLKDFSINYHGHGTPVYADDNGDKIPMHITISFTMQEIEIVTKETINEFSEQDYYDGAGTNGSPGADSTVGFGSKKSRGR